MEPSKPSSSNKKSQRDENDQSPSCALLTPRVSGSRFLSCLMIAAVFILLDLAILFYFLWSPTTSEDAAQVSPAPTVLEKEVNESASPDGLQQKK